MIALKCAMFAGKKGGWTNPYITDGLVAMWDGEWNAGGGVHGGKATVWKDLVGDHDLTISGNQWSGNALLLTNKTQSSVYSTRLIVGVRTFEFVIGVDNPSTTSWSYPITLGRSPGDPENRTVQMWARGVNTIQGRLGSQDGFSLPELNNNYPTTFVVQFTYGTDGLVNVCRVNGTVRDQVQRREQAGGYYDGVNLVYNPGYHNCQRYHTIRVYSRALTSAEIAANYAVDKVRFNLA